MSGTYAQEQAFKQLGHDVMNGFSRFTPAALLTSLVLSIFLPQPILALTPVLVTNISGNFNDMVASGNYLYAANNSTPPDSGLKIFDIRNPTSPVDVGY